MAPEPSVLIISQAQAAEIETLLPAVDAPRRADQHMARARLRSIGYPLAAAATVTDFQAFVASGEIRVDETGRARIVRQAPTRVFKVSIGVSGFPVEPTWWAFDQRYQWLGRQPHQVSSGDHLFAMAVDRWRSAVVGLYEAVSPGAQALPGSPDPNRWPLALGVRPLAAILPPDAERIPGLYGPQNPIPEHVNNSDHQTALYAAVRNSPPAPSPSTVEARVQEVQWRDLGDDVLQAVYELGGEARFGEVLERAIAIGGWTPEELDVLAWYTSANAEPSHIRTVVRQAIGFEESLTGRIRRDYSSGPYRIVGDYEPMGSGFGAKYRPASGQEATQPDDAVLKIDLAALEAATERHMKLQDRLAEALVERGIDPRSPSGSQPFFDLAFEHDGLRYVVEVKGGDPASHQQVRYGVGQVLEYAHLLSSADAPVIPVILIESVPPMPWVDLAVQLGVRVLVATELDSALDTLLQ
jgi:hypothetical protein